MAWHLLHRDGGSLIRYAYMVFSFLIRLNPVPIPRHCAVERDLIDEAERDLGLEDLFTRTPTLSTLKGEEMSRFASETRNVRTLQRLKVHIYLFIVILRKVVSSLTTRTRPSSPKRTHGSSRPSQPAHIPTPLDPLQPLPYALRNDPPHARFFVALTILENAGKSEVRRPLPWIWMARGNGSLHYSMVSSLNSHYL